VQWKLPSCKSPVFSGKKTPFLRDTIDDHGKALRVGWCALVVIVFALERDEGEYAYAGQLMLQGIPPSKLA